uniref:G-protein coupled receptor Mth-like 2-5 protein n=1 Tax=Dastarcus helophoroides TaxID=1169899 RepID=A0A2Z5H083_9CUCU|nr:G-protein coupled receptor Mth-like 2-5 protein [Dastarcus helophoroides]
MSDNMTKKILFATFLFLSASKCIEGFDTFNDTPEEHKNLCLNNVCIKKCCDFGFYLVEGQCVKGENTTVKFPVYAKETFLTNISERHLFSVQNSWECENFFSFEPHLYEDDAFYIQTNGTLWVPLYNDYISGNRHCVDYVDTEHIAALICVEDESSLSFKGFQKCYTFGMIISTPFLLATLIAYALLPDRNLHMKALMSYVFNLLMGYILLVSIQLSQHFSELGCSTIAFCCVFFFMASFFWMNVICIDIWLGFSGLRQISGMKTAETKRFLYYCLYAWGMAVLLVLAVILIDKYAPHDSWYHPEVGRAQCFIRDGTPQLLYFYGPMGIVITINVILFALTALKIRKVKKDTSMLKHSDSKRHSYESDKQRFNLYLKLLFAMGVNWSMELISWAVNLNVGLPQYIWYFTDFCNAVYGVFIFFIFVFKKNIWRQLKRRYYSFMGKPHFAHSMTTNPTSVTSYSTTVSNHDNANTDTSELTTRIS